MFEGRQQDCLPYAGGERSRFAGSPDATERQPWAAEVIAGMREFGLAEWALPQEGAGWSHAYVCPEHRVRLTQKAGKNLCPIDGKARRIFNAYSELRSRSAMTWYAMPCRRVEKPERVPTTLKEQGSNGIALASSPTLREQPPSRGRSGRTYLRPVWRMPG